MNNNNNDMVISTNNAMTAKAVLISRPNSHPFQERTLNLSDPVKIGRSVARARATATNAIFDCKVLSRHHAILWYDCGKFYLQDTKSSNGTFVNNNRLASTDAEPHEVCSGDIVQFGVDVVENNRKVTHGCIIAALKLYLPDGKEAKASPSISEGTRHGSVSLDELYQLQQIIQEASHGELCLETKLTALQHVVETTKQSADDSWQAYVGEERLLSRIAALEAQLSQASKVSGDERLREELAKLHDDRTEYQTAAKEALRKLHSERLEAVAAKTEQERAKITAEHEIIVAKEQLDQVQQELQNVALKLSKEQKKNDEDIVMFQQKEKELQNKVYDLNCKIEELRTFVLTHVNIDTISLDSLQYTRNLFSDIKQSVFSDVVLASEKEDELNTDWTSDIESKENGVEEPQQNHINLSILPVPELTESVVIKEENSDNDSLIGDDSVRSVITDLQIDGTENKDELNKCKEADLETNISIERKKEPCEDNNEIKKCDEFTRESTRTLKYQYQTAQNELKKQIEQLEIISSANKTRIAILEKSLVTEKDENSFLVTKNKLLKDEFEHLQIKYHECTKEVHELRETVDNLTKIIETERRLAPAAPNVRNASSQVDQKNISDDNSVSLEQILTLEEELVVLKERYAGVSEEKIALNKELLSLHSKYNAMCDRSYNKAFVYVAPLVCMVLYLLVSSMFS